MGLAVTLLDETTRGEVLNKTSLRLVSERVSMRELITQRIRQEVDRYNAEKHETFFGLVRPTDAEEKLNGYKLRTPKLVSFEQQLELALRAFESNGFFVLVDDRQVDELDEIVTLSEGSTVSFVKLVPLVGG